MTFKLELDFKETQIPKKWSAQCHSKVPTLNRPPLMPKTLVMLPCEAGLGNTGKGSTLYFILVFFLAEDHSTYGYSLVVSIWLNFMYPWIFFLLQHCFLKRKERRKQGRSEGREGEWREREELFREEFNFNKMLDI